MRRIPLILIVLVVSVAAWRLMSPRAARVVPTTGLREPHTALAEAAKKPVMIAQSLSSVVGAHLAAKAKPGDAFTETRIEASELEALALEAGGHSLAVAAEWVRGLPVGEARNRALASLIAQLGEKNPAAAVSLANTLKPDDGQAEILMQGFQQWVSQTPLVASQWLGENEKHPLADVLICQLASHPKVIAASPALALQWSALLEEPDARRQQIETVLIEWGHRDPAGASDYIRRSASFNPFEKSRLIKRVATEKKQSG